MKSQFQIQGDNSASNKILEVKVSQLPSKPIAEKEIQAPTNEDLLQPTPCVIEPIQHVGERLLDEVKIIKIK